MALKVLGAGFGRTGTFSLKAALDLIGFAPCHHMYEVRKSARQVDLWHDAAMGTLPDWDVAFDGYTAQVDWPASVFWKELTQYYPDAKVILTDRDPDSWYESISRTILPASEIGRFKDPDPVNRKASDMMYHLALQGIFDGRLGDREYAIKRFLDHRQEVIATIPSHRLLVFGVGDGWEPLCDFLDLPIPDQPFPRGNSTSEFRARKPYLDQ